MAHDFVAVTKTGLNLATSGTSANGTIPVDSGGSTARFIRVASTAASYIRIGSGVQTAVNTDLLVQPGDSIVLSTNGCNNIAALQVTAAGIVIVTPLEQL